MAFEEYENPEDLKRVQRLSTLILAELDRVCRKLEIPYVVFAGTALGAVRHGGFIPWDDDVDVAMARADYERFLTEAPKEFDQRFYIANSRNEPCFPCTFSYLCLSDTLCIPTFYKDCEFKKPLSIDIFPLDRVPEDDDAFKRQTRRTWFWGRLAFLRATPAPYLSFDGIKRHVVLAACGLAHILLRLFNVKMEVIQRKWDDAAQMYNGTTSPIFADYSEWDQSRWSVLENELFDSIDVPFESIIVKLPRNYDAMLTRLYGDYMTLPPVEQRKNHRPYLLDFGPYASY